MKKLIKKLKELNRYDVEVYDDNDDTRNAYTKSVENKSGFYVKSGDLDFLLSEYEKSQNPPLYVMMGGISALRLQFDMYYRDGGDWYIYYEYRDGKWWSVDYYDDEDKTMSGKELVEITEAEWRKDNGRYVTQLVKAHRDEDETDKVFDELPF